ncbi:MAG: hypothetical protein VX589_13450 [Myxococcota bacterium]|nr:hypothetical protein [Myxococcota bacterium]
MKSQHYRVIFFAAMTALVGCEPADELDDPESGAINDDSAGGASAILGDGCIVCASDAPFFQTCRQSELLEDENVRVCIDTEDDVECTTAQACCRQANAVLDETGMTCIGDEDVMPASGEGQECMTDDECTTMDFPRCELDSTRMGRCAVECTSNIDCMNGPNGNFCLATNRCGEVSDGTCQIETPDEPLTANSECGIMTPICMPLQSGASLGICVKCSDDAPCSEDSETPICSTTGVCIADDTSDTCATDIDCCPTPDADCAGRRICTDGQCESTGS